MTKRSNQGIRVGEGHTSTSENNVRPEERLNCTAANGSWMTDSSHIAFHLHNFQHSSNKLPGELQSKTDSIQSYIL